jgi:UDP-N-acetylglucosamine pyrophosphorylase
VAFLRTSESTIFYYKERKSSSPVSAVGLLVDKQGNYSFSEVNHLPNNLRSVFDDELFRNAVWKLYNSTNPDDITPVVTK